MTPRNPETQVPPAVLAARRRAEVLVSAEEVQRAIDRVAVRLALALHGTNPLVLVVMHGGLPYAGEILKRLSCPLELGYVHVSRYRGATRGGSLRWHHQPDYDLRQRTVLLLDDVLDQGETLAALCRWAEQGGAGRVLTTVLVDKQVEMPRSSTVDYAALTCPDRYLFGCGMDFRGYWRNLPAIYALPPDLEST
jgi:hypoxanthine phosphoribosyltransferase